MSSFKLSKLLLERASKKKPAGCGSNPAVETTQSSYGTYQLKPDYETWTEDDGGIIVYYYYCKKGTKPKEKEEEKPVVAGACPIDEGYGNKEFQEWVWKTYLGKKETDTVTTKLCGIKTDGTAKTCAYSAAVGTGCGDGTKAVWKDLRDKFIEFKKGSQPIVNVDPEAKKKECESKGMDYDEATKNCVAKPIVVDPDVQELVDDMGRYRTILNGFYDPTGWIQLDSLTPNEYTPNFLSIDLLTAVTTQITELIKQKGSSSDFGNFIKMMKALKNAYNNDKFKGMFQKKVDPDGTDVFTTIDTLITNITTEAEKIKGSLGYDPLVSPTEKQIRDILFMSQLRSVYKSGRINLMMMVYTYTKGGESIKKDNNEVYGQIETYSTTVSKTRNFENCKNILDVYRQTYNDGVYDQPLLTKVKSQIQKCWCDKQYEDLGKLGAKNMFDKEMRKSRKELISFLNGIGSSNKGDFAIILNDSVCGGIKLSR